MKSLIVRFFPDFILLKVKIIIRFSRVFKIFFQDFIYYFKNSGVVFNGPKARCANIIKNYHKLEKGLSLTPRKELFGLAVVDELLRDLYFIAKTDKPGEEGYLESINAINALTSYMNAHGDVDVLDNRIEKLSLIKELFKIKETHPAVYPYKHNEYSTDTIDIFDGVIKGRKSIRDFIDKKVTSNLIDEALSVALHTPSVCNRQAWTVYNISSDDKIKEILALQNGNRGFGDKIGNLLVVSMDFQRFLIPEERNQYMFDAGLFSMNLVGALEVRGVSSCFLNWCVKVKADRELRRILNLTESEKPVVLIAAGYASKSALVCSSPKKSLEQSLRLIK